MAFDIEMIRKVYKKYPLAIEAARKATGKPLTLSEKILYTHLWNGDAEKAFTRGEDYVNFALVLLKYSSLLFFIILLYFLN